MSANLITPIEREPSPDNRVFDFAAYLIQSAENAESGQIVITAESAGDLAMLAGEFIHANPA